MCNNKDQKTDDNQKLIKGSEYHLEQREDLSQKWDEYQITVPLKVEEIMMEQNQ